jgi:SPP1 gp7 family putative phage head morphogenesis protein
MAWTAQTSSLVLQVRDYLQRIEDARIRAQVAAWVNGWNDVAPDLEAALNELVVQSTDGTVSRNTLIRSARLQRALEQIQDRLTGLVDGSAAGVINQLADVVDYSGAMQERLVASQLPPGAAGDVAAWSRVDPRALDAIVARTTEQITKRSFPLSDEAAATMRRELVRGMAVGANPRESAARMVANTRGTFNGGLTRALTIARTETLDAQRAASALSDAQNADLLTGWTWTASLSDRTCSACWGMHGQVFAVTVPGPQGHQNCRCTRVPATKSWRDLGFDIDEPPSLLPDAEAQFAAMDQVSQLQVLGPRRYLAWQNGDYPLDRWATKRSNPGWRDSWVRTNAPAA